MKLRTEHYLPAALGGAARGFGLNDEGDFSDRVLCSFVSFKVVAPSSARRALLQTRSVSPP
jgi:hypothetical protein